MLGTDGFVCLRFCQEALAVANAEGIDNITKTIIDILHFHIVCHLI